MQTAQLVYTGFNSQVIALDRDTGDIVWSWKARRPRSCGYVTLLLDGDRVVVSVNGYMYCLDAATVDELCFNETKGFGTGVASLASLRGMSHSNSVTANAAINDAAAQAVVVS